MTQSILINLRPNEQSREFHYYPFAVKLDRCVGSCNTINDLSNKVCVPNKTQYLSLSLFSMIARLNELKPLTKQKIFQQILMKRKQPVKRKISTFYLHFY